MGKDVNAQLTLFANFANVCAATNSRRGMLISFGTTIDLAASKFWSTGVES